MSAPATPAPLKRRRKWSRAAAELHYQLRTEGNSPARQGLSIFFGTFVGCLPLWGVHLPLCVLGARLFGLSRVKAYLAAHINNPLTLPLLLYVQCGTGHWVRTGSWLAPSLSELGALSWTDLGLDLLVGSVLVGLTLGGALGIGAFFIGLRWRSAPSHREALREAATYPYIETGIFNWEFARGKLKWDPAFFALLRSGLLPADGVLTDLGCGRGLLLALIRAAQADLADWPADWGAPPARLRLRGVDIQAGHVATARVALGPDIDLSVVDLAEYEPPPSDAFVLLDVLHYLDGDVQEALLRRAARALRPGGILLVREADADGGLRFQATRVAERLSAWVRRDRGRRFRYRSRAEWERLLAAAGLAVETEPMGAGTPYANVLLRARRPAQAAAGDLSAEARGPV